MEAVSSDSAQSSQAYFSKEVDTPLAKLSLKFNSSLAKFQ